MTQKDTGDGIFDLRDEDRRHIEDTLGEPLAPQPLTNDQRVLLEGRLAQLEAGEGLIPWPITEVEPDPSYEELLAMPAELLAAAQADLQAARDALDAEREGVGKVFLSQIDQELGRIDEKPKFQELLWGDLWRTSLLSFPYGIVYRVREGRIQVVAVMRHKRQIDS